MALCLSIFLEAIQRFVEPQVVKNPKLVLIVGCCGLASNFLGLFLFHEHGHSHGGDEDEHDHGHDTHSHAEEGLYHSHDGEDAHIADESGNVADVLPQQRIAGWPKTKATSDSDPPTNENADVRSPSAKHRKSSYAAGHRRRTSGSFGGRGFGSVDEINIHPASFRHDIIAASRLEEQSESEQEQDEEAIEERSSRALAQREVESHEQW